MQWSLEINRTTFAFSIPRKGTDRRLHKKLPERQQAIFRTLPIHFHGLVRYGIDVGTGTRTPTTQGRAVLSGMDDLGHAIRRFPSGLGLDRYRPCNFSRTNLAFSTSRMY